jgi:hypothetical protein
VIASATLAIPLTLALSAQLGAPRITFDPALPRLGDLALVYIESSDPEITHGTLRMLGYQFEVFRVGQDKLRAAVAVPIDIEPGEIPLDLSLGHRSVRGKMKVVSRSWDSSQLKVSKEFTQKKSKALLLRLKAEEKALLALWEPDAEAPHFIGGFGRPVEGEITGLFGTRRIFNGKLNSIHYGLDLEGQIGDTIRSIQAGKVVMSSMRWASGGTTIIDHGGGLFTAYFHMSRRDKKPGDWVRAGEVIGAVGKSGRVTGPHLHLQFFVRARRLVNGQPGKPRTLQVDPEHALDLRFDGQSRYVIMGKTRSSTDAAVGGDDEFGGPEKD